jgi:hypothetical protein
LFEILDELDNGLFAEVLSEHLQFFALFDDLLAVLKPDVGGDCSVEFEVALVAALEDALDS